MSRNEPCPVRKLVDEHFEARIHPLNEQRMREHLPGCASCRRYYDLRVGLSRFDPEAVPGAERMMVGLGLKPRRLAWYQRPLLAVSAAASLLVGLLGGYWVMRSPSGVEGGEGASSEPGDARLEGEWTARGPEDDPAVVASSELAVYRVREGRPEPLAGELEQTDRLAFAYDNKAGKKHLLIFSVCEGRVDWYQPFDPREDSPAVPIEAGFQELREAFSLPPSCTNLTLYGLFVDQPVTVKEIEGALQQHRGTGPLLPADQASEWRSEIRVRKGR